MSSMIRIRWVCPLRGGFDADEVQPPGRDSVEAGRPEPYVILPRPSAGETEADYLDRVWAAFSETSRRREAPEGPRAEADHLGRALAALRAMSRRREARESSQVEANGPLAGEKAGRPPSGELFGVEGFWFSEQQARALVSGGSMSLNGVPFIGDRLDAEAALEELASEWVEAWRAWCRAVGVVMDNAASLGRLRRE